MVTSHAWKVSTNALIMRSFLLIVFLVFGFSDAFSQAFTINGKVVDSDGAPIRDVKVSVDSSFFVSTNANGRFSVNLMNKIDKPVRVRALKDGLELHDWSYFQNKRELHILMWPSANRLKGKVFTSDSKPLAGSKIVLSTVNEDEPATSSDKGEFVVVLPKGMRITPQNTFEVDGYRVSASNFIFSRRDTSVIIRLPADYKPKSIKPVAPVQTINKPANPEEEEEDINLSPVLVVVVYNADIIPAPGVQVSVDGVQYTTDERGEFRIKADDIHNVSFATKDFQIIKKIYDYKHNYMFIHIEDGLQAGGDSTGNNMNFQRDFNAVFNQLEAEKQVLQENSLELRREIAKISYRLTTTGTNSQEKNNLKRYLGRLEEALVENDLAYEEAQRRTKEMVDNLKSVLHEKDVKIEQVEAEKEFVQKELIAAVALGILMLVAAVFFYFAQRKIRRQRDELGVAYENIKRLKADLLASQEKTQAVRDIGQRFTATLDFEAHMLTVQSSVNNLLDASIFGIGIADPSRNTIEFRSHVRNGKIQPTFTEPLDSDARFSVLCFKQQKEILINDLATEYTQYFKPGSIEITKDTPKSLIYMPLVIEDKAVGVLTVQSFEANAYKDVQLNSLKTLASYAAIAVANTNAYRVIKQQNQNITDSLRYAQTIQQSILPTKASLDAVFREYFVIFRSKDIVSGDFYWLSEPVRDPQTGRRKVFFAVVDCTGHGVAGAFMSMIGNTLLNEIIEKKGIHDTVEILNAIDEGVQNALQQDESVNTDGMDICLCAIDFGADGTAELTFTGAKRPLYYVNAAIGVLETLKGDTRAIGGMHKKTRPFTRQTVVLQPNDVIYLTTDGIATQNNAVREKFGSGQLKNLFLKNSHLPMAEQKIALESSLLQHEKGVEQRDDITVVGIRI